MGSVDERSGRDDQQLLGVCTEGIIFKITYEDNKSILPRPSGYTVLIRKYRLMKMIQN